MGSLEQQGTLLKIKQLFNQQQSQALFQSVLKSNSNINTIHFQNVGIKIMRQALRTFQQKSIQQVQIQYDWNHLMMKPQLVCYDKNKWKTLQQLANWNKQWNQLFTQSLNLKSVTVNLSISWMDQGFIKSFIQGLTRLPNLQQVLIQTKSKDQNVWKILADIKQAHIFPLFQYKFDKL